MKLVVAAVIVCGLAGAATADKHQITGLSFESAPSWAAQDAPNQSTLVFKVDSRFAILAIFSPHPATTTLAAAFGPDWTTATATTPTKVIPKPSARKIGGRNVLEAAAEAQTEGSTVTMSVLLLETNGQIVPTVVYTQDRKMLKSFRADLDKMIASIQGTPPAKTDPPPAPPAADPTPPAADPAPPAADAGGARKLTNITLKDIAGSWSTHDQAITTYVNSSTGAYSGTMATSVQDWYEIKADGSYTRKFQGMSGNQVVRENAKGTITMTPDAIVFTEGGKQHMKVHFLEFAIDAEGGAHWKLIDFQYPLNAANIGLYAETWFRAGAKKK